jgi:hypothetical protein
MLLAGALAAALPLLLSAQSVEVVRFRALLSSSKELPPVAAGTLAMGEAVVEFILQKSAGGTIQSAVVDFRINYVLGQEETLTNMHIHRGAEGVSGPVVIPTAFGAAFAAGAGAGSFLRSGAVSDPTGIATLEAIMANPSGYYVNIHTRSHPAGIMRGQLEPDNAAVLAVRDAQAKLDAKLETLMTMMRQLALVHGLRLP